MNSLSDFHIRILIYHLKAGVFTMLLFWIAIGQLAAQENKMIQIKAFTESLQPYGNLRLSINEGEMISLNSQGIGSVSLKKDAFPIQTITLNNKLLEAASWNLSKGILELTVRQKSYKEVVVAIENEQNTAIINNQFTFKGEKQVTKTTDSNGKATLPLALNETINSSNQFFVKDYKPLSIVLRNNQYILKVEKLAVLADNSNEKKRPNGQKELLDAASNGNELVQARIDTITNLEQFYVLLKEVRSSDLDYVTWNALDAKFAALQLQSNIEKVDSTSYISEISKSTIVESDVKNLLKEAKREGRRINLQNSAFNDKIKIVMEKLNAGFTNLSQQERKQLGKDINRLEDLLLSNENEFYQNFNNYQKIIADLKTDFFDFSDLEDKLSLSERQRIEDKQRFQKRIMAISAIILVFALLIVLLFHFWARLKKQKELLILANNRVNENNMNLETLVSERTQSLEKTFKELDMVLYRASHDLRAPLCSIAGLSDLLSREASDKQLTNLILKTNNEMDKLLRKLSTISEINQPGQLVEVNVFDLATEVSSRFKEVNSESDIKFQLDCNKNLVVNSIPYLLEVIIYNLLENAFFYCGLQSSTNKLVKCTIKYAENSLQLKVYDNGVGVDQYNSNQLFDMFYIGSEHSDGNGLGLYIVKKSVDVLEGDIQVESVIGDHTEIIVSLPIKLTKQNVIELQQQLETDAV